MPSSEDVNREIPSPSEGITPSTRHYSGLGPKREMPSRREITTDMIKLEDFPVSPWVDMTSQAKALPRRFVPALWQIAKPGRWGELALLMLGLG